ncbi:hypothetical protein T484DRAFT_1744667 [Baffinella frigidus]|nr:hypothetical protein T484DRAFT_1744667 [Cryptophyta sp. CCMP2293]
MDKLTNIMGKFTPCQHTLAGATGAEIRAHRVWIVAEDSAKEGVGVDVVGENWCRVRVFGRMRDRDDDRLTSIQKRQQLARRCNTIEHSAAIRDRHVEAELLLNSGAPESKDADGMTALHFAAPWGRC